jgi:hypothetical protein
MMRTTTVVFLSIRVGSFSPLKIELLAQKGSVGESDSGNKDEMESLKQKCEMAITHLQDEKKSLGASKQPACL